VALGKITELPFHFYRLVLNEHLLLVPLAMYFFYKAITAKKIFSSDFLLLTALLAILSVNLTRIYMVALAVGILVLFRPRYWKRWLVVSMLSATAFLLIFIGVHTSASRGQSLGLELFGLRLQSIAAPAMEDSSLSRMLLLPKIVEKIKADPLAGTGLGDQVTVYSPIFKKDITTPHFDWGYFEIVAEMGVVGLLAWGLVILYVFGSLYAKLNTSFLWIPASLIVVCVINITSPALFHVMGILWIVIVAACKEQPHKAV